MPQSSQMVNSRQGSISVLLVDADKHALVTTAAMLSLNLHQVTTVSSGSAAMQIIADGKKQFDVVITDVDLPDMAGYQLCAQVTKIMGIPVLFQGLDQVQKSQECGATFVFQKPADQVIAHNLHRFIVKQKMIKPDDDTRKKKNKYIKWDEELHAKFIAALAQLDEASWTPKNILEKMNVPGLERMQVASYLQKCRNRNWLSSKEYKKRKWMSHFSRAI